MQKGKFRRPSSAPEARKEHSCQSYSASHIKWRAERSFHRPTFIHPGTTDTWLRSFAVFLNSISTTIQFQAVVTHPNKKPAVGVRVLMAANFTRGKDKSMEVNQKFDRDDPNSMGHTDLNGEVDFAINTQSNYHLIIIKVQKKTRLFVSKKSFRVFVVADTVRRF